MSPVIRKLKLASLEEVPSQVLSSSRYPLELFLNPFLTLLNPGPREKNHPSKSQPLTFTEVTTV